MATVSLGAGSAMARFLLDGNASSSAASAQPASAGGSLPHSLSQLIDELSDGVAFPARLRLFCDPRLGASLPAGCDPEWPGLDGASLAAAACGAALAERVRGGRV